MKHLLFISSIYLQKYMVPTHFQINLRLYAACVVLKKRSNTLQALNMTVGPGVIYTVT